LFVRCHPKLGFVNSPQTSIHFFDPDGNRIEYFCNNQDDSAEGLRLMGDETRKNKELVLN
jgi:hypothetical protein